MLLTELAASNNELLDKVNPRKMREFVKWQTRIEKVFRINNQVKLWQEITSPLMLAKYNNLFSYLNSTGVQAIVEKQIMGFFAFDFAELYTDDEPEVEEITVDESKKIKRIISNVYKNHKELFSISAREFEEMIAELLRSQGFEVQLSKQTRDNGYDILAIVKMGLHADLKFLVECKRFKEERKVGVGIIRSFKEVISTESANKGIIVTTSYFSKDAIKKRKETPYLLDYRDKNNVMEWVANYWNEKIKNK